MHIRLLSLLVLFISNAFSSNRYAITLLQCTSHHISRSFSLLTWKHILWFSLFHLIGMWCVMPPPHRKSNGISHTHVFFIHHLYGRAYRLNLVMPLFLAVAQLAHTRRRFLISLNSIDCINFDAKTIIYWIKINCSICILRFVPLHAAAAAATTNTTTRAQYNFYSWFWISSLSFSPSICCECACLRSLFYSSLQLYSPHHISYLCLPLCLLARLLCSYWWSLFARSHARFTNTLLVNFYWAQSIL